MIFLFLVPSSFLSSSWGFSASLVRSLFDDSSASSSIVLVWFISLLHVHGVSWLYRQDANFNLRYNKTYFSKKYAEPQHRWFDLSRKSRRLLRIFRQLASFFPCYALKIIRELDKRRNVRNQCIKVRSKLIKCTINSFVFQVVDTVSKLSAKCADPGVSFSKTRQRKN